MDIWAQIEAIPRLDRKAESDLGRRLQDGDDHAHTRLVEANLWVAVPIAKGLCRKSGGKWEAGDLLSEATRALMDTATRWDYAGPVRFGAYARMRVRGAMKDFLRHKADVVKGSQEQAWSLDADEKPGSSLLAIHDLEPETISHNPLFSDQLTRREREVFDKRIMAAPPVSISELAKSLGVKESTIRQDQARIARKLVSFQFPDLSMIA